MRGQHLTSIGAQRPSTRETRRRQGQRCKHPECHTILARDHTDALCSTHRAMKARGELRKPQREAEARRERASSFVMAELDLLAGALR